VLLYSLMTHSSICCLISALSG